MRHEVLSEDPDLVQAIDDLMPTAREMRARSAQLLLEPEGPHRKAAEGAIREAFSRIELRAGRIGTTGAALVEILGAVLDAKARRGRGAPAGDTSRTLLTAVTNAIMRENAAHLALTAAQAEVKAATEHRAATEEACRAFGIKRIIR